MNPYETNAVLGMEEFLRIAYLKMKKKIMRLQEIEDSKVREKLPLPVLKEKFEITRNVLKALQFLQRDVKEEKQYDELVEMLGFVGFEISLGNIGKTNTDASYHYQRALFVINGFLK